MRSEQNADIATIDQTFFVVNDIHTYILICFIILIKAMG